MLGCAQNMDVGPRSACPHDVSARWLVSRRQARGFRIKGPKNHPMWSDSDGWGPGLSNGSELLRCVAPASMYSTPGTLVVGFTLCSAKSRFHCIATLSSHIGGDPTPLGSPGRQVKSLVPWPEDFHLSLGIHLSYRGVLDHIRRTRGEGARNFALSRLLRRG